MQDFVHQPYVSRTASVLWEAQVLDEPGLRLGGLEVLGVGFRGLGFRGLGFRV